jgi:tripartite-type tricarboxylate transporter receptor subunit TctC
MSVARTIVLLSALFAAGAHAQTYPQKPVRIIVPYVAGGDTDIVARIIGPRLAESLGQQFIVENRPGAGSLIGTEAMLRAPADGYTLAMGTISSLAVLPVTKSNVSYDPRKDFAPVALVTRVPYVLFVHPSLPARSVKELVQIAKQRPGVLVYGSPGIATGIHLASEFFALNVGVKLTHIPYKGGAPAMVDLAAGNIALMFSTFSTAGQHLASGRLRALAVADAARNKVYGLVPTMSEAGFAGLEATTWHGMVARAGVPRAIITRLNAEIARAIELPEVRNAFASTGLDLAVGTADDFDAFIRSEYVKWEKVAKVAKITTD